MYGDLKAPADLAVGDPIFANLAIFNDGNYVMGGVLKSGDPSYNIIFMWAFRANGTQYSRWPIDVSDVEDFEFNTLEFQLNGCEYVLNVEEKKNEGFLQMTF